MLFIAEALALTPMLKRHKIIILLDPGQHFTFVPLRLCAKDFSATPNEL